jgi:hypothetical protein
MWQTYNIEYDAVVKNKLVPVKKWIFLKFVGRNEISGGKWVFPVKILQYHYRGLKRRGQTAIMSLGFQDS